MSESVEGLELTFPLNYPIKIMGKNNDAFKQAVQEIVTQHIPEKYLIECKENLSKEGNYLAITVRATFHDKPSIDAVYQALSDHPNVYMAL